jgi:tRNA(Arg) A34 adenosine deaminase TadA
MSERHRAYVERASRVARRSALTHRHGAVLVHSPSGEVLSEGWNRVVTWLCHKNSVHAEVDAVLKAKRAYGHLFRDCTMYVVRVAKSGDLRLSKPCMACAEMLRSNGVGRVFYSTSPW